MEIFNECLSYKDEKNYEIFGVPIAKRVFGHQSVKKLSFTGLNQNLQNKVFFSLKPK